MGKSLHEHYGYLNGQAQYQNIFNLVKVMYRDWAIQLPKIKSKAELAEVNMDEKREPINFIKHIRPGPKGFDRQNFLQSLDAEDAEKNYWEKYEKQREEPR